MKILVVDDELSDIVLWDIARAYGVTIHLARTEREAMGMFLASEIAELGLILMDGYLEKNRDTEDLVRWIRQKGYVGPMITISGNDKTAEKLVKIGCSEAWNKFESIARLKVWVRGHTSRE